jgi:uncharacterized protein (TIGR04222 family)
MQPNFSSLSRPMNEQHQKLYQQIQDYSLDQPEDPFPFTKRLARENKWSLDYAQQVIAEYKKFVFLAIVADHVVTPSDQVDQVWHLHLTYTRSYWQEFCSQILQMPLHHEPSRGGHQEQTKYRQYYQQTLDSYEFFLGQKPPTSIWPDIQTRFGDDLNFTRINTLNYWLIPKFNWQFSPLIKPRSLSFLTILFVLSMLITGCQSLTRFSNPLNMAGPEFLDFYFQLSWITFVIAHGLRWLLRLPTSQGKPQSVLLTPYETAYLANGQTRLIQTVISKLTKQDCISANRHEKTVKFDGNINTLSDPMEIAIAQAATTEIKLSELESLSLEPIKLLQEKLASLGLLIAPKAKIKALIYPSILIGLLLLLGITKICVGISRDKPVGFLIMFCILLFSLSFSLFAPVHRSRYGDRIFNHLQAEGKHLKTLPYRPESFALFGAVVLDNEPLLALHSLLTVSNSNGNGSNSSCGGGGGGGGGGGCGGCGGG